MPDLWKDVTAQAGRIKVPFIKQNQVAFRALSISKEY